MSKKSSGKKPLLGDAPDSIKEEKKEEATDKSNNKDNKREGSRSGRGGNRDSRSTSRSRRNRSRSPLLKKWNDKDVCRDFLRNRCNRRDCKYYHPPDKEPQRMSWFTLCLDFQKGNCTYDDCRFFHLSTEDEDLFIETGEVSLHIIEQAMCNAQLELPTEKDQPTCKDYLKGRCKKNNCRYRHITSAEYESELYQCIQDALQEILGPPRGSMGGNFPNQRMPLLGDKGSLLGPVPSSFTPNLPVNNMNNSTGALLNQLRPDIINRGEKTPLISLPPSLLPLPDDGLNDVESLRRVCRQLQSELDNMHRERDAEDRRRNRNMPGNMLQNRGGGSKSDDQCLMSQLNSELKEEVEKLRMRNDELVNQIYSVDWEHLCSEAKMQVQSLEDENHNLRNELHRREKQISNLKKDTHLWKNYEILVKDQLSKLQKQFFVAEREFCVSWGGGPPPLESQREAWNAIKSTVSVIARANIHHPSSLKPPPDPEPASKKGPSKTENISKDKRSQGPALDSSDMSKSEPYSDPLKPPFLENFFQPGSGRSDSPRIRSNAPVDNRPNHPDIKSNQESMRKNSNFRSSSPNNARLGSSNNVRSNFPAGSKQDEPSPTSFWKSSTGSFSETSTGGMRQNTTNNPSHSNQRPVRPGDPNIIRPDVQNNLRTKALGDDRPNSVNQNNSRPNHPGGINQMKNPQNRNQEEDSYGGTNNYPNDNLIRYPMPAKEQYNTGIPGTYMNEASQKNAENAEYQASLSANYSAPSSGYYSSNANTSGNYSADSSGYYSSNAANTENYQSNTANTENYPADSSAYYSNVSQTNAAPASGNYPTNNDSQAPSDKQGSFTSTGNYPEYSASSGQYSTGSYGYNEGYGSYVDNSSKNAEIISQMYSQPPPPPPSQGSPNKNWSSTDSWKSGYYG